MRSKSTIWMAMIFMVVATGCSRLDDGKAGAKKVVSRNALQSQGERLVEIGRYDEALIKYREAMQSEYITDEYQKATSVWPIVRILKLQGKYPEAISEQAWFLKPLEWQKRDGPSEEALEQLHELEALWNFSTTGNSKQVHKFIQKYSISHASDLPPKKYDTTTSGCVTTLVYLYDAIGDYDAGIAFIDEILHWTYETNPEFKGLQIASTTEIGDQYIYIMADGQQLHPNWRAYKWLREHLLIREAFEQDKSEGKQGSHKEGKPGRATLALIQSDYFPW